MKISRNLAKYKTHNPLRKFLIKKFINKTLNIVNQLPNITSVLDAGCGEGMIMTSLIEQQKNLKIDGLDISADSIAIAKQKMPESNFFISNVNSTNLTDSSYDLVLAMEILEHLEKPELALIELKRLVKQYILISVPFEPYFSIGNLLFLKNLKLMGKDPEHIQFFNQSKIKKLIEKEFKIKKLTVSFPWIIILAQK